MINDQYYNRHIVISGIVIGVVLLFIIKLFFLQIIDQTTQESADNNALYHHTIYPSRGLIYDRHGELLVFNQPIYDVTIVMREMGRDFDTLGLCQLLAITQQDFNDRIATISNRRRNLGYSPYTPQILFSQLHKSDIAALSEELYRFPGIAIQKRTLRDYQYASAAHILGSVGEVNQNDIDRDPYYQSGDYAGRDGLERTYEKQLRGLKGDEVLMRDARGRIQGSYHEGEIDKPAIAGSDMTITIDIQLQLLAEKLLNGKIGSAVAIEPATGEVLAMVSNPAWDPKRLVGRERSANYNDLAQDETKPLMNRATQAMYSPGSTFKLLQSLVCLQEGGISPNTRYDCNGPETLPIKCTHHHGSPVDLGSAIEQSCNPYFWCAFRDMLQKNGYGDDNDIFRERYNLWRSDIMQFGLGQRFEDTDIAEQAAGCIPSESLFNRIYGRKGWKAITIRSLSIGQGEILVTPLQLANEAAIIANEGYYITPHLNKHDSLLVHRHETTIQPTYFRLVKEGMHRVMTNGTGRWHNIDSLQMCGKTGTVQNPHGEDHAIFIGFAPQDHPKIAVAVVVENCGFGATWAAPVATLMMEQYLLGTVKRVTKMEEYSKQILNSNVTQR